MVETLSDREVFSEGDGVATLPAAGTPLPALPSTGSNPLRFASGGAISPSAVPAARPRARTRRRTCSDLFDLAVVVLIIVCAATCLYRLFWAMQP